VAKAKVLVVDDDPVSLEIVRERLEKAGYEVILRDQALGTSEFIFQNRPDVVLLDVRMPGLSGDKLAAILSRRDLTRNVVVILHSGSRENLAALAKESNALGAIVKTADDRKFLAEFEALLARAKRGG
jgi:two-component system, OmpR family, response regulator